MERSASAAPLGDRLPNLVVLPQRQVGFPGGLGEGSCLRAEQNEHGAERCLRLEQAIADVGQGPMEIATASLRHV